MDQPVTGEIITRYCKNGHLLSTDNIYIWRNLRKCLLCKQLSNKKWKTNNRDKISQYNVKYNEENKNYNTRRQKEYYKARGKERNAAYYQENKEIIIKRNKKWKVHNRDKLQAMKHRRLQRYINQMGRVSNNITDILLEKQTGKCYYCEISLDNDFHLEHKVPLSRGGLHTDSNLCISCVPCNLRKGSMTDLEFITFITGVS